MTELTLYNGDCLEIMKGLPEKSVDLIICDLPYGCLTTPRAQSGGADILIRENVGKCSWDVKIDLKAFWEQVKRIRKSDHSPTIHFCTTKFGYELIKSNEKEFRYDLVWDKGRGVSFLSANKMPMRSHEMIYVFSKAGAFYERKDIEGDFKNTISPNHKRSNVSNTLPRVADIHSDNEGRRCVLSVIKQYGGVKKEGHPTEKPEALYRFLIERYCPPGGTVLDPTFGSGNSVFTAFDMGRNAIGIEKDDAFYKKAEEKLNA